LPDEVLRELDQVCLDVLDKVRPDGVGLTEEQKRLALRLIQMEPGYIKISEVVQKGSDSDLEMAKKIIREQFATAIRKPLLKAVKALDHPKGGRPKLLTDTDKRKACDEISELMRMSGLELREAVQRAADRYGVSVRTMQRVWQGRASYRASAK
jgi:hypothetical protein